MLTKNLISRSDPIKMFKKTLSLFLAVSLVIFNQPVFAVGKDGVEILPDGTKLTWIPTEKIEQKAKEYHQNAEKLLDQVISPTEDFVKSLPLTIAEGLSISGLIHLKRKIKNKAISCLCLGGVVLISGEIVARSVYIAVHNHEIYHKVHGRFEGEGDRPTCCLLDYIFGSNHEFLSPMSKYGGEAEKSCIDGLYSSIEEFKNGIVIVERPKGFKTKEPTRYGSGVYSQAEWEKNSDYYYNVLLKEEGVK